MIIKYGLADNNIDVTSICYSKLKYGNIIAIPAIDNVRAIYFGDPVPNVEKSVFLSDLGGLGNSGERLRAWELKDSPEKRRRSFVERMSYEYDLRYTVFIDTTTNKIRSSLNPKYDSGIIESELSNLHQSLQIRHGSLLEELNEQKMAVRYLTGNEKVLEIGGNIGRNSIVIGSILNRQNNSDYVVLESDPYSSALLTENRDLNHLRFHIEGRALSKRPLIQKGWQTIVSDEVLDGYSRVNTVTYEGLAEKYNIAFDTLVLDCEGAFYYILQDMPEILQNIRLIIVENDYLDMAHKEYVDSVLKENGFYVDYVEMGGWGPDTPCYSCFYEVWKTIEGND